MSLPPVSREALIEAIRKFDAEKRADYPFQANRYVIAFEGKHYPPKVIVSLATGRGVDTFSGGKSGANKYVENRGFTVLDLAEVGRETLGLQS